MVVIGGGRRDGFPPERPHVRGVEIPVTVTFQASNGGMDFNRTEPQSYSLPRRRLVSFHRP